MCPMPKKNIFPLEKITRKLPWLEVGAHVEIARPRCHIFENDPGKKIL
jgi:hypothetical protein